MNVEDHHHRLDARLGLQVVMLVLGTMLLVASLGYLAHKASLADQQAHAAIEELRATRSDVEKYQAKVGDYLWRRDRAWDAHIKAIPIPEPAKD
jgi:hypothetical protein